MKTACFRKKAAAKCQFSPRPEQNSFRKGPSRTVLPMMAQIFRYLGASTIFREKVEELLIVVQCRPLFYTGTGAVHCSVGMRDLILQQKSQCEDPLLWGCQAGLSQELCLQEKYRLLRPQVNRFGVVWL